MNETISYEKLYSLTKNLKVLYIEDDLSFQKNIQEILCNFFSLVDIASNGKEGYDKYLEKADCDYSFYDIVISDIFMPKINGLELTKKIYQKNPKQSIMIISAHDESHYLLEFVNIGIEHFLVKPFEIDNIMNSLYKITNKLINTNINELISLNNNYVWNKKESQLLYRGNKIKLTKKEIRLMELLVRNGRQISTIEEIIDTLWIEDPFLGSTGTLNPLISRFRKKLPEELVLSIYGMGYKLNF